MPNEKHEEVWKMYEDVLESIPSDMRIYICRPYFYLEVSKRLKEEKDIEYTAGTIRKILEKHYADRRK